jgi:hypothetical protein
MHTSHLQATFAEPPHPEWTPGTPQQLPFPGSYISVDPKKLGGSACYPLVISAIVPRPIGFLSTISAEGTVNLSPYSYFGAMGHDPPLVCKPASCSVGRVQSMQPQSRVQLQCWQVV